MSEPGFTREQMDDMFAAIDRGDGNAFVQFLSEDASFRFGSAPPVKGRADIEAGVGSFFASIAGCSHAIEKVLAEGDTLVCEGEVTYTRHDESTLTVPFVDVFELEGQFIRDYKIYVDISSLYDA